MMTGVVIRMAQFLGLQRDGSHFKDLSFFDIEIRRRVWWGICALDARAAEDQGTELTIVSGSFDTKIPLNINDGDIHPEMKKAPKERDGLTDMSLTRVFAEICEISRQMMTPGFWANSISLEDQSRQLDEIYQKCEDGYLQYTETSGNIAYWAAVTLARLVKSKMTLFVFLPVFFSSPSQSLSEKLRTKLLVSAIEVAEYNHELNSEEGCRQWRWLYQSCTHWHAVVYLLIEIPRRRWSSIVERAWVALHSSYLMPPEATADKHFRTWVPIRKLMAKVRQHRAAELARLQTNAQAVANLEMEDRTFPVPSSSGPFPTETSAEVFHSWWRQLVGAPNAPKDHILASLLAKPTRSLEPSMAIEPVYHQEMGQPQGGGIFESAGAPTSVQTVDSSQNTFSPISPEQINEITGGYDIDSWLWTDIKPGNDVFSNLDMDSVGNMDLDVDIDWQNWIQSATTLERGAG
jgi:hypothetical protein